MKNSDRLSFSFFGGPLKIYAAVLPIFFVACTQQASINTLISQQNTGIVNGETVSADDPIASHTVAITDDKWENCTGTLIASNLVLTAAHCETPGVAMYVAFGLEVGEWNLKQVERRLVTNYRLAPGRAEQSEVLSDINHKDMMIVQFEGGLPEGYKPAKFLEDTSILQNNVNVILAGYGVTSGRSQNGDGLLRKAEVPILDVGFSDTEIQTDERKRGSCSIDSGGPAFIKVADELLIWGVTSRGDVHCRQAGIYTKISSFRSWIDAVMQELGPTQE